MGGEAIPPDGERTCSWCGAAIATDDGFRVYEIAAGRRASFCRLEHVVPWAIRGPRWGTVAAAELPAAGAQQRRCSYCDGELVDPGVLVVRHRGAHRIADRLCSVDHLNAWAKAGGRWR